MYAMDFCGGSKVILIVFEQSNRWLVGGFNHLEKY
jgi:hypothetical protein